MYRNGSLYGSSQEGECTWDGNVVTKLSGREQEEIKCLHLLRDASPDALCIRFW